MYFASNLQEKEETENEENKHKKIAVAGQCPLVHNITNYVTVNDCANIQLACGASPIMAYVSEALAAQLDLGKGSGPLLHSFDLKSYFGEEKILN